jgi:ribonuclease BN (tRNA processing enzyme)
MGDGSEGTSRGLWPKDANVIVTAFPTKLAELASKAKPRLLIIYHASIVLRPGLRPQASSPEELLKEVLSGYNGEVVVARDLDVY